MVKRFIDILNEQHEEIKSLKKENVQLKQIIDRLTLDNTKQKKVLNATKKENEQLKQQLSDINGQLVMLDNCDNWDYDRMKHTVREIAEIIGYNGTINPKGDVQ